MFMTRVIKWHCSVNAKMILFEMSLLWVWGRSRVRLALGQTMPSLH